MATLTDSTLPGIAGADAYGPPARSPWMDIDWRRYLHWAIIDERAVNYVDIGEGDDAVVFVHGLSGSWQNWLENIPHFARSRRVIALDLPGFGESEMPREKISIDNYARCIDRLLDQLDVECAALVGNSMGGFTGAQLAIEFPTRVEKLVLVSAAGLTTNQFQHQRVLPVLRRAEALLVHGSSWFAKHSGEICRRPGGRIATLLFVAAHPDRLPAPLVAEQVRGSGKPGFMDALEALGRYPIEQQLHRIECPTLIVWGEKDRLVPLRDADRYARAIGANARKLVYEDTGHVAMLERPARFNRDVEAFLAKDTDEQVGEPQ